jgi:hypothetical protein
MKKFWLLLFLLCFAGVFSLAQEFGNIRGRVLDNDGNALPGVTVSLTGSKIGPRSAVTSTEGNYRFLNLPNGTDYVMKFELSGFKSVTREALIVSYGKVIELNITMEQATLEENVTVVGQTPLIDTKKTTTGTNINAEQMMSLPNARNPWVLMQMAPGMLLDREDVGGAEGGQQSQYLGHGASPWDSTWNIDGANITDNAALGGTPAYLNMSGFEEIQINYGSNDITMGTGGVQLNYVTYKGGNKYTGMIYVDATQKRWQSENRSAEMLALGYKGGGVNKLYLYGVNFGGPIIKDKLWFYGSYGIQDLGIFNTAGRAVRTFLESGYAKLDAQLTPNTRVGLQYGYNNKDREGREPWGDPALQGAESTWHQVGPSPYYRAEVEQMFGNLYLSAKYIHSDNSFLLFSPQGMPTADGSGPYEYHKYYPSFYAYGNINNDGTNRPMDNASINGNLFVENFLGLDHEIKFGVDILHSAVTSYSVQEANLDVELRSPEVTEVSLYRDFQINFGFDRYSVYAQDLMTSGRFTFRLGLRYDNETSYVQNIHQPASPWLPQYLADLTLKKLDPGIHTGNFSPRVGFIWDVFGTGKDVVKFSVARYGAQIGPEVAGFVNPVPSAGITLRWVDGNGDGRVTSNELWGTDWATGLPTVDPNDPAGWTSYYGFDVNNPTSLSSFNKYDPDYNCPLTDEMILSYEKELITDLSVRVEGIYRRRHRLVWDKGIFADGSIETAANWYLAGTEPTTGAEYYGRYVRPTGTYRTNAEKNYEQYYALQFVFSKRLSHRWMLDGSFTWNDWKYHYNGGYGASGYDLTNVSYFDNAPLSSNASWVYGGTYVTANWMFKISGLYQLPLGFNFSFNVNGRQGYPCLPWADVNQPNVGWINVYAQDASGNNVGKFGGTRLPNFFDANFRLEKQFMVTEAMTVTVGADCFNAFNSNTAVAYQTSLTSSRFLLPIRTINPRVFRFGVHVSF